MLAGKQADELSPATMATLQCLHRAAKSLLGYVPTTGTHLLKNRRCCHGVLRCFPAKGTGESTSVGVRISPDTPSCCSGRISTVLLGVQHLCVDHHHCLKKLTTHRTLINKCTLPLVQSSRGQVGWSLTRQTSQLFQQDEAAVLRERHCLEYVEINITRSWPSAVNQI